MNDDKMYLWSKFIKKKFNENINNFIDDDVMNQLLEFDEKKPNENVMETFESQLSLGVLYYLIGAPLMIIWYYVIRILDL